ncbi:MAG: hypothetical protein AAGM67_21650, partial [Bacteroidota bacterium]
NDSFPTEKGPLVKGWGDATPATKNDVEVRVNGVPVDVKEVNPYIGEITLEVPIPLAPAGTNTVEVDYKWFANPTFEMAGLNTPGLVLNKWDFYNGLSTTGRFPFSVTLPDRQRIQPKQVGFRYQGFERAYTAALNDPTSLLLNQSPHAIAVDKYTYIP